MTRIAEGRHVFRYYPEITDLMKQEGFLPYTEFQDVSREYNGNVLEIFAQRLTRHDRPDILNYYRFWEVDVDKAEDRFYVLGKTQGLLPTDNFELLAQYRMSPDVHFLTEIAGLSMIQPPKGSVAAHRTGAGQ